MTLQDNDLHEPHTISVLFGGVDVVVTVPAVHFDGLTRQRIIVAAEKALGGRATIEDGEDGEPVVLVTAEDGHQIARGTLMVNKT